MLFLFNIKIIFMNVENGMEGRASLTMIVHLTPIRKIDIEPHHCCYVSGLFSTPTCHKIAYQEEYFKY